MLLGVCRMRPRFALNGLNFFIAAVQAGFGPFIAVWLTQQGWSRIALGLTLSIGTFAGLLGQLPGGCWSMHLHTKRFVASGAMVAMGLVRDRAGPVPVVARRLGRRGWQLAGELCDDTRDRSADPFAVRT